MNHAIDKIIKFKLSGKFAHFRKFYTNASSLSYLIPPRTVIIGLIASILKIPRDEYYDVFDEESLKVSVCIPKNLEIRKQTQSLNYLHNKYFNLIAKGNGTMQHSQCKLELLMFSIDRNIEYIVYLGFNHHNKIINKLEEKLIKKDFGFGVYFGQRQFKADIEFENTFEDYEFVFYEKSQFLDSACSEENFISCDFSSEIDILTEQMPVHFKQIRSRNKTGREPITVKKVFFEKKGRRITGEFRNCYFVDDKYISFY